MYIYIYIHIRCTLGPAAPGQSSGRTGRARDGQGRAGRDLAAHLGPEPTAPQQLRVREVQRAAYVDRGVGNLELLEQRLDQSERKGDVGATKFNGAAAAVAATAMPPRPPLRSRPWPRPRPLVLVRACADPGGT